MNRSSRSCTERKLLGPNRTGHKSGDCELATARPAIAEERAPSSLSPQRTIESAVAGTQAKRSYALNRRQRITQHSHLNQTGGKERPHAGNREKNTLCLRVNPGHIRRMGRANEPGKSRPAVQSEMEKLLNSNGRTTVIGHTASRCNAIHLPPVGSSDPNRADRSVLS